MKILETQGLITSKTGPGGGVFISAMAPADAIQLLDNLFLFKQPSIADIYAMRKLLEPELAAGLAGKLTPEAFAALQATIRLYEERTGDGGGGIPAAAGRARLPCRAGATKREPDSRLRLRVPAQPAARNDRLPRDLQPAQPGAARARPALSGAAAARHQGRRGERARTIMREHMEEAERYMLARAAMRGCAPTRAASLTMPGTARHPYDSRQPSPFRLGQFHRAGDPLRARARRSPSIASTPATATTRRTSTAADIATMNPDEVNPVTGPVFVEGAEPGDALKVTIRDFAPSGFGWTAIIPGFRPARRPVHRTAPASVAYDRTAREPMLFGRHARVPVRPFAGTHRRGAGGARAIIRRHSAAPGRRQHGYPRPDGGRRALSARGSARRAVLHRRYPCRQGDGEVCGTAVESAMAATVTLDLIKGGDAAHAALHGAGSGDAPRRRRRLRRHHRDRPGFDDGGARRPLRHDRPADGAHRRCRRKRHICCAPSAATCASARSSMHPTGWFPSISRAPFSPELARNLKSRSGIPRLPASPIPLR